MSAAGDGGCAHEGGASGTGCITCADAAKWVRVVDVDAGHDTARCLDESGRSATVATELVGTVARDDALLVHAGVAIHREPHTKVVQR